MLCLLYALEACPINKNQEKSLKFTINRVFTKVFCTKSIDVVQQCRLYFGITEVKSRVDKRRSTFLAKYRVAENGLCQLLANVAAC